LGDGVNIAARLQPLAEPGGICISVDVARQVQNNLEARVVPLGPASLKNIRLPMEICRIVLPWQATADADTLPAQPAVRPRLRSQRLAWVAGALVLSAALGAAALWMVRKPDTQPVSKASSNSAVAVSLPAPTTGKRTIVVRKLVSQSTDSEYLGESLTDGILNALMKVSGFWVIDSHDSELAVLRREIGEGVMLGGSLLKSDQQLLITIKLENLADNRLLWSEEYPVPLTNLIQVRGEMTAKVARALKVELLPNTAAELARKPTENSEAYDLYLLGRHHAASWTEEGSKKALECFGRAIQLDTNFALAWAGLATTYDDGADFLFPATNVLQKAKEAAQKAISLDDTLGQPHVALGKIERDIEFDWSRSEREFQQAIARNEHDADAHNHYSWMLTCAGRYEEALAETRRAVELDPLSVLSIVNGSVPYALLGDKDRAVAQIRKALEIDPKYWYAHFALGWIELLRGNFSMAIDQYSQAKKIETFPFIDGFLGYAQAKGGHQAEARLALQQLDRQGRTRYISPACQAFIYLGLEDKEQAIARLEEAYLVRSQWISMLKIEPLWDPLRGDRRFQALLKKAGLDH
jgi:tetratricopeptide (TPR) repeat protein